MVREDIKKLIDLRHELHKNPELSGEEKNTSERLIDFFKDLKPDRIKKIGETGFLITFQGKNPSKNVLIRSELDALPIQEINDFNHKSFSDGISHKCGHDGHMVMLAGFGQWCASNQLRNTTIHLLYQPAEETGQGARQIVEHPEFDIEPDYAFAIHNIPGFRKNLILVRENHFSASVISIIIKLTGKTAHAGEPERGINPAMAVSEIVRVFDKLNNNNPENDDFFISTPVFIKLGDRAFGTSAGEASLGFTFRCWDQELMKENQGKIKKILGEISDINNLKVDHDWLEEFYANYNDPEAVKIIQKAAERANLTIEELQHPFRWGEDFGFFTSKYRGAMIGLGSGEETPALHNPDYDFPDDIIETGVNIYKEIVLIIDEK